MKFKEIMDALLVQTYENQLKHRHSALSDTYLLREFGLIQLNPGRAIGKSTYIAQTATSSDLVITPFNYNYIYKDCRAEIHVANNISLKSKKYDKLWIDEPTLCNINEGDLLRIFTGKVNSIIMLGY
jgi:hypothetical protein